ncbi:MAG: hypothetical protein P1R58_10265 [bacterium]|nr:hypothetical protein [bacterium]
MTIVAKECVKASPARIIGHMFGTAIGVGFAIIIESAGQPTLGWFVGGTIIGLSAAISFVRPEKRWTTRNCALIVLAGIAGAAANYLIKSL